MAEEFMTDKAPAIKCSYCRRIIQDNDKNKMGFETDEWAICFRCFRKMCDGVME